MDVPKFPPSGPTPTPRRIIAELIAGGCAAFIEKANEARTQVREALENQKMDTAISIVLDDTHWLAALELATEEAREMIKRGEGR